MPSATHHHPDPNLPNEIKFDIGGKTVLLLTVEGMTYNGQFIQDAGEAHKAMVDVLTEARGAQAQYLHTQMQRLIQEVREFAKWSEGIFHEYANLKPDDCDAPEVQAETAASIDEDRQYLQRFMAALNLTPEGEEEDENEAWIYTAEYLSEIITYGMVEGGYMPDSNILLTPPGPSREEMLESVRKSIRCHTDGADKGVPEWVLQLLRAMMEDEVLMLTLAFEVCRDGWTEGRTTFDGCRMDCWQPEEGAKDAHEQLKEMWAKFVPPAKPQEPPVEANEESPEQFGAGDYVNYKPGRGVLHCGSGAYSRAVVASMDPFILVSESGDMVRSATVKAEDFVKLGIAGRSVLMAVIDRFRRELHPAKPKEVTA